MMTKCLFLNIFFILINFNSSRKLVFEKGGSKKIISNFKIFFSIKFIISLFIISALLSICKLIKFFFIKSATFLSRSTNVTLSAPLERHSKPKEPLPEYRSRTLVFFKSILSKFEC